jgi:putative MATE family efflux protein
MQVDEKIRELTAKYFFILFIPMLFRTATSIFGMVLRAAGDTKTPMVIGIAVNIINIILNFLFIYPTRVISLFGFEFTMWGWGQGVIGAATASAIAFAVGGILITIALMRHKTISPRGYSLKPDGAVLRPCFKVALPNLFQGIATSLGYVVFASMINSVGDTATAACTIANTVESAFYIPGFGMKTAASTLAGNAYGAKDNKKMKELARMFIPIEIFLMIISGAALFIFAPALVGLFSKSDEVINLGATVLRMVALSEPFYGFSIIMEGFLVGVGKTKTPFLYTLIGMWGVRIVGTFILINLMGYGLVAAWGAMIAHNMLLFVLYLVCYLKGKWNPLNVK